MYLYAILPFFTFLQRSRPPGHPGATWNVEPQTVRQAVTEYLEDQLQCVIRRHRLGFELVTRTGAAPSNVGAFLAALKLFYTVMREVGCYAGDNPLLDVALADVDDDFDNGCDRPSRMPDVSGVEAPRSRKRLTDSFFKLVGRDWVPPIIDDLTFPVSVLTGGRKCLAGAYGKNA